MVEWTGKHRMMVEWIYKIDGLIFKKNRSMVGWINNRWMVGWIEKRQMVGWIEKIDGWLNVQ